MTDAARTALVKIGIGNATLLVGDGTRGPGGREDVRLFEKQGAELVVKRSITGASFVPLYGERGYALADAPAQP